MLLVSPAKRNRIIRRLRGVRELSGEPRTRPTIVLGKVRLNHVTLTVADVERSADFYARLGLRQIVAAYPGYARFLSPEGDTTLSLHRAEGALPSPSASIHFEVDDVDRVAEELKGSGFTFACEPVDQPYLWREAIMLDPDGHQVFIYHAGQNRLHPPWRLPDEGQER
ncbi:MAG TPA: VOC family protein [Solirubrobacteraceae bacterium]|jgi:catechol 2,3-dioxygenase-like lactoylglutathione lyase family enzyme|nr:VOC family protein [Solirubrobacteraceae bacterium]